MISDEDMSKLMSGSREAVSAGEALLGEVCHAGLGWFARDRAGMFHPRPRFHWRMVLPRAREVHALAHSLLNEVEPLMERGDLPRTGRLLHALRRLAQARDGLWDVLVVLDAVERLGGGSEHQNQPVLPGRERFNPVSKSIRGRFKRSK